MGKLLSAFSFHSNLFKEIPKREKAFRYDSNSGGRRDRHDSADTVVGAGAGMRAPVLHLLSRLHVRLHHVVGLFFLDKLSNMFGVDVGRI